MRFYFSFKSCFVNRIVGFLCNVNFPDVIKTSCLAMSSGVRRMGRPGTGRSSSSNILPGLGIGRGRGRQIFYFYGTPDVQYSDWDGDEDVNFRKFQGCPITRTARTSTSWESLFEMIFWLCLDMDFDPQASYTATNPQIKGLMHHSGV